MRRASLALILLLSLTCPGVSWGQEPPTARPESAPNPEVHSPLSVGLVGPAPFVILAPGTTTGLSVELWEAVARNVQVSYQYRPFTDPEEALKALRNREIDILVGPVTITAQRAANVAFTEPYFRTSLGIASPVHPRGAFPRVRAILTRPFAIGLVALLVVLFAVGLLVWLAERKHPETLFPKSFGAGVAEGMWLAVTTMSTVGYGDRYPVTSAGRVLCGCWMLVSLVTVSSITAFLATTFTVAQMNSGIVVSAEQLAGRPVAVVRGSMGVSFALEHQARVEVVQDLDEAMGLLRARSVDAVVHDRPILAYFVKQHPEFKARLATSHYQLQDYGLAVALGSPLLSPLNVALLRVSETGEAARLTDEWIGQ